MIITSVCIALILLYLILIAGLSWAFDKVKDFKLRDLEPKTKFSVIIPFRNEAKQLPKLLSSISKLNYPKSMYEIILVNDASQDNSVAIINSILNSRAYDFNKNEKIKIIENKRLSNSPKKDAINTAINVSEHDWILTTDADCILPKYWLDAFDEFIQTYKPNCIVAPVTYVNNFSFFKRFQALDFLSLQGATIGGFGLKKPFLCNGANFGYRKSIFKAVEGFVGNTKIASGDDVFLLEKLLRPNRKKVLYLKSEMAIVSTQAVLSVSRLIQQRLRWAAKTSQLENWFVKLVGITVFLANLTIIALIPLIILKILSPRLAIALSVIKFSIDFLLLFKTARFYRQENLLVSFVVSVFIYPFFSVYIVLLSFLKSYNWKGRTFKT